MNSEVEHVVVINDEEQYSIWPAFREIPAGWYDAGFRGPREACLDHIESVWTDITPRSVREALAARRESVASPTLASSAVPTTAPPEKATLPEAAESRAA